MHTIMQCSSTCGLSIVSQVPLTTIVPQELTIKVMLQVLDGVEGDIPRKRTGFIEEDNSEKM